MQTGLTDNDDPARYKQWVCWTHILRDGKASKLPIQMNGKPASVTDAATWSTYEEASNVAKTNNWGIGFVLTSADPFVVIDLDKSNAPDNEALHKRLLDAFSQTYSEISPSGNGFHIFCIGNWKTSGNRFGSVEVYQSNRFITVTRNGPRKPILNCQPQLDRLFAELNRPSNIEAYPIAGNVANELSDEQVIERAKRADNGGKFIDLWEGRFASHYSRPDGTGDQSRADFALINMLVFYCGNADQTKRLFWKSALGQRDKAKRSNYLEPMLAKALSDQLVPSMPGQFDSLIKNFSSQISSIASAESVRIERQVPCVEKPVDWPILNEAAMHGITGSLVRAIEPNTEADPVAIVLQFLTAVGCLMGRKAYFQVESSKHYPNLFCVIVGNTAKARKGTSWSWVREIIKLVDPEWSSSNVKHGLVSGEGLIFHVRDPQLEEVSMSGSFPGIAPRYKTVDNGVSDKRLLINEQEFSSVLSAGNRDGSTLSDHIRNSWDGNEILQTLSKNNPAKATNAHISIIGHITQPELAKRLSSTDCFNGFGNRFLWSCVKRSKLMPTGSGVAPASLIEPFAIQLRETIAKTCCGQVKFSESASQLWANIYCELADEKPGLFGAMTARAEAQIVRLSLIFALLDSSHLIEIHHLKAAKAIWDYCEKSVEILFGNSTGNTLADRIFDLISQSARKGMSRTEISNSLNRNKSKQQIDQAIDVLLGERLIRADELPTRSNRTESRYFAI